MSNIERAEDGTLKVTWTRIPASEEDHYLVPLSHADKLNEEFDVIRERLAGAVEALEEILDDLGGGRIRWEPNYPEVDHAIQVAQGAIEAFGGS